MHKHISFTIAAMMVGLAMAFWFKAAVVETNAEVGQRRVDVSSTMSPSYLPVLKPVW
jgi:hypothetical protein